MALPWNTLALLCLVAVILFGTAVVVMLWLNGRRGEVARRRYDLRGSESTRTPPVPRATRSRLQDQPLSKSSSAPSIALAAVLVTPMRVTLRRRVATCRKRGSMLTLAALRLRLPTGGANPRRDGEAAALQVTKSSSSRVVRTTMGSVVRDMSGGSAAPH